MTETTPIQIVTNILGTVTYYNDKAETYLPAGTIAYAAPDGRGQTGDQPAAILYVCPCGCKGIGALPLFKIDGKDAWNWNGNRLSPTLTPSIHRKRTCGWHGYLTDGVFTA